MNKTNKSTYLNNLGIINALGNGKNNIMQNLLSSNQKGIIKFNKLFSSKPAFIGAVQSDLIELPDKFKALNSRNNQLIATAYQQIKADVERLKNKYGSHRIGIVLGTSTSGIGSAEKAWRAKQQDGKFPENFDYAQQEIGSCSTFLAQYANIGGISYTISTACSSSGKAVAAADRLIKSGLCDVVITGGSDSLCELTLNGFDTLELISSEICQPFSKNRSGLNIGEGAALFILSKEKSEIKLSGIGESSDGYHISAPDPKGAGGKVAIKQALESANLLPQDIGYINLHGTATHKNDEVESKMVYDIFGDETYCSSTKPLIGHTLGAAGAHELAFCWLLLSEKYNPKHILPAHVWDKAYDPDLPEINLISSDTIWQKKHFMSNSFAFGGSNVSLIIGQCD